MKLEAFKVAHFRCLYNTDWIPFSEFSIFTGENDGGKSTTLYALEMFLTKKRPLQQVVRAVLGCSGHIDEWMDSSCAKGNSSSSVE